MKINEVVFIGCLMQVSIYGQSESSIRELSQPNGASFSSINPISIGPDGRFNGVASDGRNYTVLSQRGALGNTRDIVSLGTVVPVLGTNFSTWVSASSKFATMASFQPNGLTFSFAPTVLFPVLNGQQSNTPRNYEYAGYVDATTPHVERTCLDYTVNGKNPAPSIVLGLSFYKDEVHVIGIEATDVSHAVSTIYRRGTVTNGICDLRDLSPRISLNRYVVQIQKESTGSFVAEIVNSVNPADLNGPLGSEIVLISPQSIVSSIVGPSTPAPFCCRMVYDTVSETTLIASLTGSGGQAILRTSDGHMRTVYRNENGLTGQYIRPRALRGDWAVMYGGNENHYKIENAFLLNTRTGASYSIFQQFQQMEGFLGISDLGVTPEGTVILGVTTKLSAKLFTFDVNGVTGFQRPTALLSASSSSILSGDSVTLKWGTTGAYADLGAVTIDQGIGPVPVSGAIVVSPTETTVYSLFAAGPGGNTLTSLTVSVAPKPPPVLLPTISNGGVVNTVPGVSVSPSSYVAVYGANFADSIMVAPDTPPSVLGGTQVLVNGVPVPILFVSPGQVNIQIPPTMSAGSATIQVIRTNIPGNVCTISIVPDESQKFENMEDR